MKHSINILHLEDDPDDAELIKAKLDETDLNYRIAWVQTRDEFTAALGQNRYDLILSDFRLPMYDGMSALKLAQDRYPDIPFIFVSGTMGEDAVIEGLTKGATDYVLKLGLFRLPSVIKRALQDAKNSRKRRRIKEELAKLSSAVEQSANIVIITDIKGHIEYANPRFTGITGYGLKEVLGQPASIMKSGHTPDETYRCLWETITAGKEWRGEFYNKKKNGEFYWESVSISPIRNAKGRIINFLAIKEDITEKKKLEAQFFQAQKMESVGRLAGGVAHDFNNLLGIIMGHTELALDLAPDPAQPIYSHLHEILKASERSSNLTRQLLAFARKQTVAPKVIDLNKTIEEMLNMIRRLIGENIDLIWYPGTESRPVKMDPSQIDQILANLCVNARDAISNVGKIIMETGTVFLDESYCIDHPGFIPGAYVVLTVSDNGQGMDKKILEKIFEPFFTTKESGKGTGLGLATVYGIIKQNNGFINVYSEIGQGTTFRIYLPRYQGQDIDTRKAQTTEMPLGHGETLLLVEDEAALLTATQMMLEKIGYRVIAANTPDKAIELAEKHAGEIQLLITDVVMPKLNGMDLAGHLQSVYPEMKVLFMSGYASNAIVDQGVLKEGANFIQKPFSLKEIAIKIADF
jgi:PAS domain S-box-containing protein